MVQLREKLHLARQRRKLSSSSSSSLSPVSSTAAAPLLDIRRDHGPRSTVALETLPHKLLARIVSFCELGDLLRLRCSCRSLRCVLDQSLALEAYLRRLMDVSRTNGTLSRHVLVDMIKLQLGNELRDDDTRRDVFLCLAVSIPAAQQLVFKKTLGPLVRKAHDNLQTHIDDLDVPTQLERNIGIASTLFVLGCWDICHVDIGTSLMAVNTWTVRSTIWSEKTLLKKKHLSLQLAFSMVMGLLHPSEWPKDPQPSTTPEYRDLAKRVRADFRAAEFTLSSQSFWLSWEGLQTRSLQLAGLIAYVLRVGGFKDVPRSDLLPLLCPPSQHRTAGLLSVHNKASASRSPSKIPLLENFCEGGIRPQSHSWQEWYTSRVRDLVESIGDEEWYGYYVYTLDRMDNLSPLGFRDPAMENIYFTLGRGDRGTSSSTAAPRVSTSSVSSVPHNSGGSSSRYTLSAQGGKDGVTGEFDFVGSVAPNTGQLSLRKTYRGAHYWDYDGVMTPVGIVGEWGREGTGYNGFFWLWKRSWMAPTEEAVQRTFAYA